MICRKCGANLSYDAVFCDKCGSFVFQGKETNKEPLVKAGKRHRNTTSFWLFFRITALAVIIAAGIFAVIFGYNQIIRENNRRMYGSPTPPEITETASPQFIE